MARVAGVSKEGKILAGLKQPQTNNNRMLSPLHRRQLSTQPNGATLAREFLSTSSWETE